MDEDNQVATLPSSSSQTRQSRLGLLRPKRRALIVGLAGVTGLIAVGGGLTWWARSPHPLCVYRGHHDYVKTVAWSPDGKRLASGGRDNIVQIWNAATGANIFTYRGHKDIVQAVAWSPDGKRIASSSVDTTIQIWNAINGNLISTIHSVVALTLASSLDGTRLASGGNKVVQVWNASDGGNVYTYHEHSGFITALAWSPDSKRIASSSLAEPVVQVWNASDGTNVYRYRGHTEQVNVTAWSPNGKRIASGSWDQTVQVWNASERAATGLYMSGNLKFRKGERVLSKRARS